MTDPTPGYFRLTPEQRAFKEMIDRYPSLSCYWDFENSSCDLDAIKASLSVLSSGEALMMRFFVSVWLGENTTIPFDVIDAVKTLDTPELEIIRQWLDNPVFP